jgi:hypothetical protein
MKQISKIKVRSGLQENLPQLDKGEFGWAVDSQRLFIGNGTIEDGAPFEGNTEILTVAEPISGGVLQIIAGTNINISPPDGVGAVLVNSESVAPIEIQLSPGAPGNFTVAHGLGVVPTSGTIAMQSGGQIWRQTPTWRDSTNLYLTASDGGILGVAVLFV